MLSVTLYPIFRQLLPYTIIPPIFRMPGGSARLVVISICSYRQALEGHRSRESCRYATKKQEPKQWTPATASAKPGNIGISFEISFILSLPYEIVKRFAKVGPDAGLRGCSSFFVNSRQKEKRKANILRTVFLARGAQRLRASPHKRRTRTNREDLFRDRSYFKHPRRDRQAFCENRVGFGVGGVFAAGEPLKRQKKTAPPFG